MIKKVARIVAPTLLFSTSKHISYAISYVPIIYIINIIFSWKKFSQEHVFPTLWPILENASSGKLNQGRNIVKTKLNNF